MSPDDVIKPFWNELLIKRQYHHYNRHSQQRETETKVNGAWSRHHKHRRRIIPQWVRQYPGEVDPVTCEDDYTLLHILADVVSVLARQLGTTWILNRSRREKRKDGKVKSWREARDWKKSRGKVKTGIVREEWDWWRSVNASSRKVEWKERGYLKREGGK